MSINAGRLKKHIEIWRYQNVVNSAGADVNRLAKVKTVYGEIRPVRGSEYTEYYKDQHELSVKITIRYWSGLRPTDVLVYHDRQYVIQSIINPEELNYILEVMCTENTDKHRPVYVPEPEPQPEPQPDPEPDPTNEAETEGGDG